MTDPERPSRPTPESRAAADAVFAALRAAVQADLPGARLVVAYSGGPDSTALLHAASTLWPERVTALHANHGLRPEAALWVRHCERCCRAWRVPLRTISLRVEHRGQGLEAAAREARYAGFEDELGRGDVLLLGQHRDDQAETVLLRLLRGAGPEGLAGMPRERALGRGRLIRPFLSLPRAALEDYNSVYELNAVRDPGNADVRYDRVFLRREILPRLAARWPACAARLAGAADLLREQGELLAVPPLARTRSVTGDPGFTLASLPHKVPVAAWAIRRWLREFGLPMPARAQLAEFLRQLREGGGASLETRAWRLARYRHAVYVYAPLTTNREPTNREPVNRQPTNREPENPQPLNREPASPALPAVAGVPLTLSGSGDVLVQGPAAGLDLCVRLRRPGDALRGADGHRKTLKKVFQQHAVPPWWRARLPLLVAVSGGAEEVLCVGGIARSASARARGLSLRWSPPSVGRGRAGVIADGPGGD